MQAEDAVAPEAALRRILAERASALARPQAPEVDRDSIGIVVVRCGAERYGLEMRWVQEVHPVGHLTPVPGAGDSWAGLMNLRGVIYGVLDAIRYLELQEADRSPAPQVLIVGSAQDALGLLVDEVLGLERVPAGEVRPPLNTAPSRPGVVSGVTTAMVPMIDVEAILGDPLLHHVN